MAIVTYSTRASEIDRRSVLALVGAVATLAANDEVSQIDDYPDGELLSLGEALDVGYRRELHLEAVADHSGCDTDHDSLINCVQANVELARLIANAEPVTLDDARVVAQAYDWQIKSDWEDELDDLSSTERRLAARMARFLLEAV